MAVIKDKKCMIIGAVPMESDAVFKEFNPTDYYVICADGGYDNAVRFGITPDLVIGDFDSAQKRPAKDIRTVTLPVHKDVTDTMGAVLIGQKLGMTSYVLVGCIGGARFDHSIANLHVLLYIANHGGSGVLCTEDTKIFVLRGGRVVFTELKGATVSVFPFDGSSCNVTYEGLEYPLYQKNLMTASTLGTSNSIVADRAEIRVNIGCAVVVLYTPKE